MSRKTKVSYFYDSEYTGVYYGADHPMKPQRIAMAHELIAGYGLLDLVDVYRPRPAADAELEAYHDPAYLAAARALAGAPGGGAAAARRRPEAAAPHGFDADCPAFEALPRFCALYAGASLEGARQLASGAADVAINWAGGLHHAKRAEASGFCYVNDCVLAILELLKAHARVLYVDIDVHHGDGVEEAFYATDRVMTLSLHGYRPAAGGQPGFFPGTGALDDAGEGAGRGYSVNVPLAEGCGDDDYLELLYKPILREVMAHFQPGALVLQCGADAVVGDRLGAMALTVEGHAAAVAYARSFGLPTLVLGGGGYTKTIVARAWALDTAALLGVGLDDWLPDNPYLEYYAPETRLHYNPPNLIPNLNRREDLERTRATVLARLRGLAAAPGVGPGDRPPEALLPDWAPPPGAGGEEEEHARLMAYAQAHHAAFLQCVERGEVEKYR